MTEKEERIQEDRETESVKKMVSDFKSVFSCGRTWSFYGTVSTPLETRRKKCGI